MFENRPPKVVVLTVAFKVQVQLASWPQPDLDSRIYAIGSEMRRAGAQRSQHLHDTP